METNYDAVIKNAIRAKKFKEAKPIMFSSELVKAILEGKKTQTRRLVKPQPEFRNGETGHFEPMDDWTSFQLKIDGYNEIYDYPIKPRYRLGDIVYVPECQAIDRQYMVEANDKPTVRVVYKADGAVKYVHVSDKEWDRLAKYDTPVPNTAPRFISPYWTTKETARLFLEITDVRVEKLQEISELDSAKEGIRTDVITCRFDDPDFVENIGGVEEFAKLWDSTIKKDKHDTDGWDANPWVFVYEFKKVEKEG